MITIVRIDGHAIIKSSDHSRHDADALKLELQQLFDRRDITFDGMIYTRVDGLAVSADALISPKAAPATTIDPHMECLV